MSTRFEVALSFAGDHKRDKIRATAKILEQELGEGKVFFDEWFEAEIAGVDAQIVLQRIYGESSQLVVACICSRYGEKPWTQDEWRAILSFERGLRDAGKENLQRQRFLPIRFDDGDVDGLFKTAIVPDCRKRSPEEIAKLILQRLSNSRGFAGGSTTDSRTNAAEGAREKQRKREQEEISKRQALEEAKALRLRETEQHEALIRRLEREEMEAIARPKEAVAYQELDISSPDPTRIVWPPRETLLAIPATVRQPSPAHGPISAPVRPPTQSTPNFVPKPNLVGTDWKSKRPPPVKLPEHIRGIPHIAEIAGIFAKSVLFILLAVGAVWAFIAYEHRPAAKLERAQNACNSGSAFYCELLGQVYYSGSTEYGAVKDVPTAVTLLRKACDGRALSACVSLGALYGNGVAIPKDMPRAALLWQKACDGNDYRGCENLGILYEAGSGVNKDLNISRELFQKACSQANPWPTTKSCDELKKPVFQ